MSARGRSNAHVGAAQRQGMASYISPRALYARPMALRRLYTDAGTLIRRSHREAAAIHQENSR